MTARTRLAIAGAATVLSVALLVPWVPAVVGAEGSTLDVEIAEIGSRFRRDDQFVDADGQSLRGNHFLAEGYVYEAGTLTCDGFVCNGVVYDAEGTPSPEFPERVVGTWLCTGEHVEDSAGLTGGPINFSTQLLDLGDVVGETTIVTTGLDIVDQGVPVERAVTGGTGDYAGATGTQIQRFLGVNNIDLVSDGVGWGGVVMSMSFDLE